MKNYEAWLKTEQVSLKVLNFKIKINKFVR